MERGFDLPWSILDHIPVGIFVLDGKGNYLYVNEAYCSLVDKTPGFFEGSSIPKLQQEGYLTSTVWEQVVETRQAVAAIISITDEKLNRIYDALTIGVPLFNEDGSIRHIIYRQETMDSLMANLQKGMQNRTLFRNTSLAVEYTPIDGELIAESPQMKQIVNMLSAVSKTDVSILITGSSGTGKEMLANYIHHVSARRSGPLVAINCAAIPENLLESELFGYEKGAFTGALREGKRGLIESADGGTLFLDEINSMPLAVQVKLLRVLETKQIMRIGSIKGREVDFRLVCASNEDLQALVEQKLFRSDLFYRINVISVSIPPLRERRDDILPLALHFIDIFCKKYGCVKALSPEAIRQLTEYDWPGNVRELRNMIERIIVTSSPMEWEIRALPLGRPDYSPMRDRVFNVPAPSPTQPHYGESFSLRIYLDDCEKAVFQDLLAQGRSPKEISRILKIDISNVYRKLQKHRLD